MLGRDVVASGKCDGVPAAHGRILHIDYERDGGAGAVAGMLMQITLSVTERLHNASRYRKTQTQVPF